MDLSSKRSDPGGTQLLRNSFAQQRVTNRVWDGGRISFFHQTHIKEFRRMNYRYHVSRRKLQNQGKRPNFSCSK
jgi:hypothetical protein